MRKIIKTPSSASLAATSSNPLIGKNTFNAHAVHAPWTAVVITCVGALRIRIAMKIFR